MDVNHVIDSYAKNLTDFASLTGLRSGTSYSASGVSCRISGYSPTQLNGSIIQGDQHVILLKGDLDAQGFPRPVKGDKMTIGGVPLTVQAVDPNTRKIGTTIIAYEVQVRG